MAVGEGEVLAVLGASGSGKSTLLRILAGLERPSAGTVHVFGLELGKLGTRRLDRYRSELLGYADQHYERALGATSSIREAIALPLGLRGVGRQGRLKRADELLERVGLLDRRDARPTELSGGEQQRVAVCAALAHRPRLFLADEPTGELDAATARRLFALIVQLAREDGATTVLVSHDPEVATIADRVVEIRDGRLASERVRGGHDGAAADRGRPRRVAPATRGVPPASGHRLARTRPHDGRADRDLGSGERGPRGRAHRDTEASPRTRERRAGGGAESGHEDLRRRSDRNHRPRPRRRLVPTRGAVRAHGPVGLRQVHLPAPARRPRAPHLGRRRRAGPGRLAARPSGASRAPAGAHRRGRAAAAPDPVPERARERRARARAARSGHARRPRPPRRWRRSPCSSAASSACRACRAANRCASRSPAQSPPARSSCSPTSRPPASTRPTPSAWRRSWSGWRASSGSRSSARRTTGS